MDNQPVNKHQPQEARPKPDKYPNTTKSMASTDTRPMDEYDTPWDKKTARHNMSKTCKNLSSKYENQCVYQKHVSQHLCPKHVSQFLYPEYVNRIYVQNMLCSKLVGQYMKFSTLVQKL